MQRLKAVAWLLVTGFVLFAPPGTLIVIGLLIVGWIGGVPSVAAVIVGSVAAGVGWLTVRARRERKRRSGGR